MRTKRNWFAFVLAVCMLLPLTLCSCGEDAETESKQVETSTMEITTNSAVFPYIQTGLDYDSLDFNGRQLCFLYRGLDADSRHAYETYKAEFDSADKIDNAVFNRNELVQAKLNMKFKFVPANGAAHGMGAMGVIEFFDKAEVNEYQLVSNSNYGLAPKMKAGNFMNLAKLPYIDLTKAYWSIDTNNNATIHGTIFGVTGSISLYLFDELFVTFVNKKLCVDSKIDPTDLYKTVSAGDWDLDYMINLTKDIYDDKNRNGEKDYGDVYGYAIQITSATDAFQSSCDITVIDRNDEGDLIYAPNQKKLTEAIKKIHDFTWNSNGVIRIVEDGQYLKDGQYVSIGSMEIGKDQALFSNDRLFEVKNDYMKGCTYYGILPYPKYTYKQKNYYSLAHDSYTVYAVPITAKSEADLCGAVLESLADVNHNTVMPVYYEEVLTTRYAKDPDSVEMLNIIFTHIKMDTSYIFNINGACYSLVRWSIYNPEKPNIASTIRTLTNGVTTLCEGYSAQYKKFYENVR